MAFYRFCASVFFNCGGLRLLKRKYKNNSDFNERLGEISDVPEGAIWIHAVSVGEVQSASSLICRIRSRSPLPCVLSTVTGSGRNMAEKLLGGYVAKIFSSGTPNAKNFSRSSSKRTINLFNPSRTPRQKNFVLLRRLKLFSEILPFAKNAGISLPSSCASISGQSSVSIAI